MKPVPPGMSATYDHDGAQWRFGGNVVAAIGAGLVMGFAAGVGFAYGGWMWAPVALVLLVALLVMAQAIPFTRAQVTLHAVLVEHRSLTGLARQTVRLDDITHQAVASSDHGSTAVVLRTRDETVVIGSGQAPEHLAWFSHMIEHARALRKARDQEEGREWTFLRKAPEEIGQLRDR